MEHLNEMPGAHKATDEETGFTTWEILCVPIRGIKKAQTIGAIELLNKSSGIFSEDDQSLLTEATHNLSLFIEKIYLKQKVASLSNKLYKAGKSVLSTVLFLLAPGFIVLLLIFVAWAYLPKLTG